jgi:hypothetical protein
MKYIKCFEEFGSKLLAPNGENSNLNFEQYKLVRTPTFKKWFGDWENDPDSSSKVVDENGEPMVVWHRTYGDFTKFDNTKGMYKSGFIGGNLFYFSDDRYSYSKYGDREIQAFVNLKNPTYKVNVSGKYIPDNNDGAILLHDRFGEKEYVVIATQSNQIKLADGSNTTFDPNNPDIRY